MPSDLPYRITKDTPIPTRIALKSERSETGCILWTGALTSSGYPSIYYGGKAHSAHRDALILEQGPPPPDKPLALHTCDVKRCVNGKHMYWGDYLDNAKDARERRELRKLMAA